MRGNREVTKNDDDRGLRFQTISRLGQTVHAAPDEAIDRDHCGGHHDGCGEKEIEVAAVGGLADRSSKANRSVSVSLEMEVLCDDAGVPRTAGGSYEAGDEVGEYPGQDELLPALHALKAKD